MANDDNGEYEVGYGKPPRSYQFVPGVSGFKGRKKKRPEAHCEIIARIRDEEVIVNGKLITKFELALQQVFNRTIKSGKTGDLKNVLELLDKYGAIPKFESYAQTRADADAVLEKISTIVDRQLGVDPADGKLLEAEEDAEVKIVMNCSSCAPTLRKRWAQAGYKALVERYGRSKLHSQVTDFLRRAR